MAAASERPDVARALKDAGLTALMAFGLFLPLIGFLTVSNIRNELVLQTRFPLLLTVVAIIAAGRLFFTLVIEPWSAKVVESELPKRGLRPVAERTPSNRQIWKAVRGSACW